MCIQTVHLVDNNKRHSTCYTALEIGELRSIMICLLLSVLSSG